MLLSSCCLPVASIAAFKVCMSQVYFLLYYHYHNTNGPLAVTQAHIDVSTHIKVATYKASLMQKVGDTTSNYFANCNVVYISRISTFLLMMLDT